MIDVLTVPGTFKGWGADNDRFQRRTTEPCAQLASRTSASMKFGAGAGADPYVKDLITDSITGPGG